MTPILEVQNLTHVYSMGTPFAHRAISDISMAIYPGEFLGMIGHTGSGKSTLISHLNGLLRPTQGKVLYPKAWDTRQLRFHVGLVFQYPEYQLFEDTVEKDIAFGPKNMGLSQQEIQARVEEAAELVELTRAQLCASPFQLSGGQRRRAAIAGVLAMRPEVLILDEPTAGLDPSGRDTLLRQLKSYRQRYNAAIVMVSHSMEEIAECVDRLVVLQEGRLVLEGTPAQVFSQGDTLREIGLSVPQVTLICDRLRDMGLPLPEGIYTVEAAARALTALRGDRHA